MATSVVPWHHALAQPSANQWREGSMLTNAWIILPTVLLAVVFWFAGHAGMPWQWLSGIALSAVAGVFIGLWLAKS